MGATDADLPRLSGSIAQRLANMLSPDRRTPFQICDGPRDTQHSVIPSCRQLERIHRLRQQRARVTVDPAVGQKPPPRCVRIAPHSRHVDEASPLNGATPPSGPRRLRHIESILAALRSAGLSPRDAARAGYHFNNFLSGFAADEGQLASHAAATPGASRKKMLAEVRRQFKGLPADQYPTIVALADHLAEDDQDALFESGLNMYLQGIRTLAKPARKTGSPRR